MAKSQKRSSRPSPEPDIVIPPVREDMTIPPGARCQEASPQATHTYIACGAPAVAIVDNGDSRPYYMCQGCASHNVKNRGAKLVTERKLGPADVPTIIEHIEENDPVAGDVALIKDSGSFLSAFMADLRGFFTRAKTLEDRATSAQLKAAGIHGTIVDKTSDQRAREELSRLKTLKGEIEDTWQPVTSKLSKLHKQLTGKRGIALDAVDSAIKDQTREINRYDDAEKRRVAEEEERIRRENERRAAEEREQARQRAEAEALDAEASAATLSDKERRYVEFRAMGKTPAQAAQLAGYTAKHAMDRLETAQKVVDGIAGLVKAREIRRQADEAAAMPTYAPPAPEIKPQTGKVGGQVSVSTWSADVFDEAKLIQAILAGEVPATDLLIIDRRKANDYARALKTGLNAWPGIRAVENKTIRG